MLFAKGLYHGFTNELLLSTHLLIPQLENSLRYLLFQHGVLTSGYDAKGIQEEFSLGTILSKPELTKILGEDLVFDLKGLLVEPTGSNLRNELAHGLLNHDEFYAPQYIYLWWLILRLVCLPIIVLRSPTNDIPNSDQESND